MIVGLGAFASLFYLIFVREASLSKQARELESEYKKAQKLQAMERTVSKLSDNYQVEGGNENLKKSAAQMTWRNFIVDGNFYLHGMVYMLARIAVNVTMSI